MITAEVGECLGAVDAVVIATPARSHAEIARCAVEAGKPCLVEKPFALDSAAAADVARLAAERGVPVLAGHLLLFHPAVERLRNMVRGDELGRILYLYSLRLNLGQVRADENALWSFGPHDISVALHLLQALPVRVAAHGRSFLQVAIDGSFCSSPSRWRQSVGMKARKARVSSLAWSPVMNTRRPSISGQSRRISACSPAPSRPGMRMSLRIRSKRSDSRCSSATRPFRAFTIS